jgi:hypothetical protein
MKSLCDEKPWALKRQDDNGHVVEIDRFREKEEAERVKDEFEQRGHKQLYFVEKNKVKP